MTDEEHMRQRADIVHQLRSRGWSRMDAEDEVDAKMEERRERLLAKQKEPTNG